MSTTIPIASLQPYAPIPPDSSLEAEVSLLWPYSSSHASCALLLVHPDFRQRHARGEIRIRFEGKVAKRLAEAHVGIGDRIRLDLADSVWQEPDKKALSLTPGRPVEAELLFARSARLAILDAAGGTEVKVVVVEDESTPAGWSESTSFPPSTPGRHATQRGHVSTLVSTPGSHASSGQTKRLRLSSGHYLNSPGLLSSRHSIDGSTTLKRRSVSLGTRWTVLKSKPTVDADKDADDDEETQRPSVIIAEGNSSASTPGKIPPVLSREDNAAAVEQATAPKVPDPQSDPFMDTPGKFHTQTSHTGLDTRPQIVNTQGTTMAPPPKFGARIPMPALDFAKSGPVTPRLFPLSPGSLPMPSPFPQTPLSSSEHFVQPVRAAGSSPQGDLASTTGEATVGYFDVQPHAAENQPPANQKIAEMTNSRDTNGDTHKPVSVAEKSSSPAQTLSLESVIRHPELVETLESVDAQASPTSGSAADVSSEATPAASPTGFAGTKLTQLELLNSIPPDSSFLSMDDDPDQAEEDEDEVDLLSGRSTPSDDQEDEPFTSQPFGIIADTEPTTIQFASQLISPMLAPISGDVEGQAIPSTTIFSNKLKPEIQADADLNDEDAAWQAMDVAMHDMAPNAHELQQAPTIPLTSVLEPKHVPLQPVASVNNAATALSREVQKPIPEVGSTVADDRDPLLETEADKAPVDEAPPPDIQATGADPLTMGASQTKEAEEPVLQDDKQGASLSNAQTTDERAGKTLATHNVPLHIVDEHRKTSQDESHSGAVEIEPVGQHTTAETAAEGDHIAATVELPLALQLSARPEIVTAPEKTNLEQVLPQTRIEKGPSEPLEVQVDDKSAPGDATREAATKADVSQDLATTTDKQEPALPHSAKRGSFFEKFVVRPEPAVDEDPSAGSNPLAEALDVPNEEVPVVTSTPAAAELPVLPADDKSEPTRPPTAKRGSFFERFAIRADPAVTATPSTDAPPSAPNEAAPPTNEEAHPDQPPSTHPPPAEPLSYLTPLTSLSPHLNTETPIDVLGVLTSLTPPLRSKAGPRDWTVTLTLSAPCLTSDSSLISGRGKPGVRADLFRPYKPSLPAAEVGDIVLLRGMLVRSRARKVGLLSGPESAWCVFRRNGEEDVRGPPVEIGAWERGEVVALRAWWEREHLNVLG